MKCPHCEFEIDDRAIGRHLAAKGGAATSPTKQAASRRNGRLGGRPPRKHSRRSPAPRPVSARQQKGGRTEEGKRTSQD